MHKNISNKQFKDILSQFFLPTLADFSQLADFLFLTFGAKIFGHPRQR
jgi:hypothetical protein